jgi:hypothetical protein
VGTQAEGVSEWGAEEVCGYKKDELTAEWKKLHTEELYDCTHQILFG